MVALVPGQVCIWRQGPAFNPSPPTRTDSACRTWGALQEAGQCKTLAMTGAIHRSIELRFQPLVHTRHEVPKRRP
jgi:hypothetical protein